MQPLMKYWVPINIEKPNALILIFGGASGLDESLKPRLLALFSRSIARAASETGAVIIDGRNEGRSDGNNGSGCSWPGAKIHPFGSCAFGKSHISGRAGRRKHRGWRSSWSDHSHFVLVESKEWGGETEMMFKLAKSLFDKIPVVAILANGGEISKKVTTHLF